MLISRKLFRFFIQLPFNSRAISKPGQRDFFLAYTILYIVRNIILLYLLIQISARIYYWVP